LKQYLAQQAIRVQSETFKGFKRPDVDAEKWRDLVAKDVRREREQLEREQERAARKARNSEGLIKREIKEEDGVFQGNATARSRSRERSSKRSRSREKSKKRSRSRERSKKSSSRDKSRVSNSEGLMRREIKEEDGVFQSNTNARSRSRERSKKSISRDRSRLRSSSRERKRETYGGRDYKDDLDREKSRHRSSSSFSRASSSRNSAIEHDDRDVRSYDRYSSR